MNIELLKQYCEDKKIEYSTAEMMKNHTSFNIGGPCDIFISVVSSVELSELIIKLNEYNIKYFIIGKGSNLLVSDDGIEGAVISLKKMCNITVCEDEIVSDSGASLSAVCKSALENSLEGIEFAYGIPGSVGGALYMNAGAYGGQMSDITLSAKYYSSSSGFGTIDITNMKLGYRTSIFKNSDMIILSVTFRLKKGDKNVIKSKMDDFIKRRLDKQPLEFPSAGSTFKRPIGYYAGALIEKNNLKGKTVNGAMVSDKHAGFIVNYNNATCDDVLSLISLVKKTVLESDGVELEPEVIYIGKKH